MIFCLLFYIYLNFSLVLTIACSILLSIATALVPGVLEWEENKEKYSN